MRKAKLTAKLIAKLKAEPKKSGKWYACLKRAADFSCAFIGIVLLAVFALPLITAIRLDSKGPALFRQQRVGKGHKLFTLYKFRTMYTGSEHYAHYLQEEDEFFVQRDRDPRVTRVGRWLRRLSLDELPQLINILKGDMSFVGPRPLILRDSNKLPPIALRRLRVRPGLTGFAQVVGRNDADIATRIAHDLYYVDHMCPLLDLKIALHTVEVVFEKRGAY